MKKVLSMALALMLFISAMCTVPVMAAPANGTAAAPYQVSMPTMLPDFVTIPANGAVYYQYKAAVFSGWSVTGYGLTSIVVDGVVYDQLNPWGEIDAPFNFNFMSRGVVAYVNDTDEEVEVKLTHNQPVGTTANPDTFEEGVNTLSIPANNPGYVADFLPTVSGEYTFECARFEDFNVTIEIDGESYTLANGSLTLELESYILVRFVISPVGVTGNVDIVIVAPKVGTEDNPIYWDDSEESAHSFVLEGTEPLHFSMSNSLYGATLVINVKNSTDLSVNVNGVVWSQENTTSIRIPLEMGVNMWVVPLFVTQTSDVDNEMTLFVEYAAGSELNPIVLQNGDNAISIPENGYYYYSYTAEKDGLLVLTPADPSVFGLLDIVYEDADFIYHYGYLGEGASTALLTVPAGQTVIISAFGAMDEDTFINAAVDTTLNVVVKDLVLYSNFEGEDSNGDLEDWISTCDLKLEEDSTSGNVANGFYSALFNVDKDWGHIYHDVSLEANTDYEITFKVKADITGDLWVKFLKSDWSADMAQSSIALTNEWTEYTVVLNSGDSTDAVLLFQYAGLAADGLSIWLDDIIVTKVESEEPDVILGDLDGNGKVNNRDLGLLQKHLNGSAVTVIEAAADLDGNGKINNRDLGLMQKALNN